MGVEELGRRLLGEVVESGAGEVSGRDFLIFQHRGWE
jgi:hypothetical protein